MKKILFCMIITSCLLHTSSCKKFLDIEAPKTSINQENVYQNDYTATSVLTGIYAKMMNEFYSGGLTSISLLQELASDNLIFNNPNLGGYLNWWRNSFTADYTDTGGFGNYFSNIYPNIYIINAAIEGITKSTSLTPSVKQRLLGEGYFLRALYYFYLVNLFGDTPLVLTTDYSQNSSLERAPVDIVYKQITQDLVQATNHLDDNYVDAGAIKPTTERVRPNLSTALSLLARVQLYQKDYENAIVTATKVIDKTSQYALVKLDSVFIKNSKETIWALQPVKQGYNTDEGAVFILTKVPGTNGPKYSYLSSSLISSFEKDDKRLSAWIGYLTDGGVTYPYAAKYKADADATSVTEYCIVIRLSELYLIRAESRVELNDLSGGKSDLNIIRSRAGLAPITVSSKELLRNSILQERRVELFTEWGHRWFDLRRTGHLNEAMTAAMQFKGGAWAPYKSVYPIPNIEILKDMNLTQNTGY